MAAEFASAALEYAVVFGGTGDAVMPITVLGVRTNGNLYVTKEGGWQAKYIPAFVRRYPFVFFSRDDGKTFTLCIAAQSLMQKCAGSHVSINRSNKPRALKQNGNCDTVT
jgi:hypothetical protein